MGNIQQRTDSGEIYHEVKSHQQEWVTTNHGFFFHEMASQHNRRRMWGHWHAIHLTHQEFTTIRRLGGRNNGHQTYRHPKIHISLDEFYYAKKDYHPVYEEAKNLSQAQVAVIEKALYSSNGNHENQIETLADKVAKFLKVQPKEIARKNSLLPFFMTIIIISWN